MKIRQWTFDTLSDSRIIHRVKMLIQSEAPECFSVRFTSYGCDGPEDVQISMTISHVSTVGMLSFCRFAQEMYFGRAGEHNIEMVAKTLAAEMYPG